MNCLSEEKLEEELLPLSVDSAISFLHGDCQYFALALAKLCKYKIVFWLDFDGEIQKTCLVHAFNYVEGLHDKRIYIDIKGRRTWKDIENNFDYWDEPILITKDYEGALKLLKGIKVPYDDENLIKDAESFIIRNMSHYDTKVKQHDF